VVKASQAVSGEIVLDRLIETLMTLALEHAGAERGLLILLRDDTPQIEAEARTDRKSIEVTLRQETLTDDQRQCLKTVKSAADNLLGIINDLLDFSKIAAGKLELDTADFFLRTTLGDTLRNPGNAGPQEGVGTG